MEQDLTIGVLAKRSGVSTSALRFYEAERLIHSTRTPGGQRRYHRDMLRRVAFVRVAQQVGLQLDEIREAMATLPDNRTPTKRDWAAAGDVVATASRCSDRAAGAHARQADGMHRLRLPVAPGLSPVQPRRPRRGHRAAGRATSSPTSPTDD